MPASIVPSRKFCCCLPVRFGVFIIAVLGIIGGGAFGAIGWFEIVKYKGQLSKLTQISLYIHSILYTVLCIVSVFGLIGVIRRRRSLISVFFSVLVAITTFSIFSGAFTLWSIFNRVGPVAVQQCVDQQETADPSSCQKGYNVVKGISVAVFIFIWLLEIWGCFITSNYAGQLDDEEIARWPKIGSDVEVNQVTGPRPL
jgi:hypothetical protein